MKKILFIFGVLLCASPLFAQPALNGGDVLYGTGSPLASNPAANCNAYHMYVDGSTGTTWASQGYPCTWVQVTGAPNMPSWYISPNCAGISNCTQVYADTQYVVDATSNSTTTVTCPDCSFTAADVGKVAWATTQGSGLGTGYLLYTTFVCPQTTIASVTNSTTVVLNNACTASGSANVVFIWGHDDGPTLASLDGNEGCAVVHVATGNTFIMDGQPFFVKAPVGCNQQLATSVGAPQPALEGDGTGASQAVFVITPNFNWAGCQTISGASRQVCFGGYARGIINIQLWGTGLTSASNSACSGANNKIMLSGYPPSTVLYGVDVAGICPGETSMEGVEMNSFDESNDLGGVQSVGQYACATANSAQGMVMRSNDCRNDLVSTGRGLYVGAGSTLHSFNSFPIVESLVAGSLISDGGNFQQNNGSPGIEVQNGAKFDGRADQIQTLLVDNGGNAFTEGGSFTGTISNSFPGVHVTNGGAWVGHQDTVNGLVIDSGGFASAGNENFQPFLSATITGNGNFTDLGANYWGTNQPTTGSTGSWQTASSTTLLFGSCRGTATSSSTLGLYGMGQFSTQNCTSTTVVAGQPYRSISRAGKVSTLACNAGTGGVNSSSGVVTVLKNGSATSITATFGTGKTAMDNTHTDTPALGDVYSIQFTTQASETLANVTCTLLAW